MKNMRENLVYGLLLIPTATELMETGHFPVTARDVITDIIMTLVVLAFIIVSRQKTKKIEELEKEVQQTRFIDSLTKLPMREQFEEDLNLAINQAKNNHTDLHLACIDINHFKTVNENYGSDLGDRLLQKITLQMKVVISEDRGAIYRLGGDLFAVLFTEEATRDTERMITNLVTLQASGDKLLETYKSFLSVGTAKLSVNDNGDEFWSRAVQDMREKRQHNKK